MTVHNRGFPIGFFYPVIPTPNFGQLRNPEGYFWHPTPRTYFQSRISPRFRFKIPNPEPQIKIREIPHPEKLIGDPHNRVLTRAVSGWHVITARQARDGSSLNIFSSFFQLNMKQILNILGTFFGTWFFLFRNKAEHLLNLCCCFFLCLLKNTVIVY